MNRIKCTSFLRKIVIVNEELRKVFTSKDLALAEAIGSFVFYDPECNFEFQ